MFASNVLPPPPVPSRAEGTSAVDGPGAARAIDLQRALAGGGDGLGPAQRRWAVGAIVAAHAAGLWALLQVDAVRDAVRESAPLFVAWIAPPQPLPAPPVAPAAPVRPQPARPRPPVPLLSAAPRPNAPATAMAPAPSEPVPLPTIAAAPAPESIVAPPAPPRPAPAPPPQVIPASAVQYLVEPAPEYPRLAARAGESGRVLVLVFIDEAGVPHQVQVARSSGFVRLDGAAVAAVQKARFQPPTLNGQSISGWANVPIDFGLEK